MLRIIRDRLPLKEQCTVPVSFSQICCRYILKTVKNVPARFPVHTEKAHVMPADFENGRYF